jgi:hypothetical protein
MKWMESNGGPVVLLTESDLTLWTGARGHDYERACKVEDYVGTMALAEHHVLVLGDEPFATTWIQYEYGGVLVRWVHADSEQAVERALASLNAVSFTRTDVAVVVEGSCWLADAADAGDGLANRSLLVRIQPGTYRVETGMLSPRPDTRLLLHKLTNRA